MPTLNLPAISPAEAGARARQILHENIAPLLTEVDKKKHLTEYQARVMWEGFERPVRVLSKSGDALVRMAMFYGYRVCTDVIDGGAIESQFIA